MSILDGTATIGTILPAGSSGRDAVHVAVIVAVADAPFGAGDLVALDVEADPPAACDPEGFEDSQTVPLAVVDPFLPDGVKVGQHFWAFILPREVTGLQHVWSHPKFPEPGVVPAAKSEPKREFTRAESITWLRDWLCETGCQAPSLETLARAMRGELGRGYDLDGVRAYYDEADECFVFDGIEFSGEFPDEFWIHMENVLGKKLEHRPKFFRCGC